MIYPRCHVLTYIADVSFSQSRELGSSFKGVGRDMLIVVV